MTTIVRYRPDNFSIRPAVVADVPVLLSLIRELADQEVPAEDCVATAEDLEKWLFVERRAEAVMGVADGDPVGFAVFCASFPALVGKPGMRLEDLYVIPKARGNGYGKRFFRHLAATAVDRGYVRLEWGCLDWNKPAAELYHSFGAEAMDEWTTYRLSGEALTTLAGRKGKSNVDN